MSKPFYSRAHPGANILVIDFETSGSTFGSYEETFSRYQALAVGAVIADSTTFKPIKTLYQEMKYDPKYEWSNEAEKIHGLTREHLTEHGLDNQEAAANLAEFILETFGTGKVMVLGHNTWFDIEAMRQLLGPHSVMPDLHHVVLDTSPSAFICIGKYRSNDVFEFFTGKVREGSHNALDDALMALETARNMRALMQAALAG